MMKRVWILLLGLATAAPVFARPPTLPNFARFDELRNALLRRKQELKKVEEYNAKPRVEKMIISYRKGEPRFEGKRLSADRVTIEVFKKWDKLQQDTLDDDSKKIMELLVKVLGERLNKLDNPALDKEERYKASKPLVDGLTDKRRHVRVFAINCLNEIYGTRKMYKPEAKKSELRTRAKDWKSFITKEKSRR